MQQGDKVIVLATGEGGVLVADFDMYERTMVAITWSNDAGRWGLVACVQRQDVRPATEDEAACIPDQAPFLFDQVFNWPRTP